MTAPFTIEQFLGVLAAYNAAVWPIQILACGLGLIVVSALWFRKPLAAQVILSILALMWALNGIGYHFLFFAEINPIAKGFAAFFVLQSVLCAVSVLVPSESGFEIQLNLRSAAGLSVIVYAPLIYEFLGYWAGHGPMTGPMFGVAPCPTTIFTIGMFLLARDRYGTYAGAEYTASQIAGAKFIGFETGGHTCVAHNDEGMSAIVELLFPATEPGEP